MIIIYVAACIMRECLLHFAITAHYLVYKKSCVLASDICDHSMYAVYYTVIGAMSYGKLVEHGVPIKTSNGISRVSREDTTHSGHHLVHLRLCIEYSMVTLAMKL